MNDRNWFPSPQVQQSLQYFQSNMATVQTADPGTSPSSSADSIDWEHEHIERYLRTFRNLRSALAPLNEVGSLFIVG